MELKDRIKRFSDSIGFSIREFERACGLTRGNISNMTGALGSDKLTKIIDTYPELNVYWLLTGKGEMIRNEEPQATNVETTTIYKSDPKDLEIIKDKVRIIALQEDKIRMLEEKVAILPAVLGSARSADTTPETGIRPHHK